MTPDRSLRCVVSGSFKFKPEIDRTIEEFTDYRAIVLAPEKGWVLVPLQKILSLKDTTFRPLPSEKHMTPKQVESQFLHALGLADFVYIENPGGYVGEVVSLEIGFAIALGIPIYSREPININLDPDPFWKERVSQIKSLPPAEVLLDLKSSGLSSQS